MLHRTCLIALVAAALCITLRAADQPAAPKRESIDFRKLKELFPAELGGIKRSEASGERNKIGDMSITTAKAAYKKNADDEKAPRIEIEVMDYGGSGAEMAAAAAIWATMEIDKDSDNGYEKTVKIGEGKHPGFETWNKTDMHGDLQVWAGKRYIIHFQTYNLPAGEVTKLAVQYPLDKLAELK